MTETGGTEAQNIAIMRRGYDAFAKGDIETLKTLFSAERELESNPSRRIAGKLQRRSRHLGVFWSARS